MQPHPSLRASDLKRRASLDPVVLIRPTQWDIAIDPSLVPRRVVVTWRGAFGVVGAAAFLTLTVLPWMIHPTGRTTTTPVEIPSAVPLVPERAAEVELRNAPMEAATVIVPLSLQPSPVEEAAPETVSDVLPAPAIAPQDDPPRTQASQPPESIAERDPDRSGGEVVVGPESIAPDRTASPPEPRATASIPSQPASELPGVRRTLQSAPPSNVRVQQLKKARSATWTAQTAGTTTRSSGASKRSGSSDPVSANETRGWSLPRALQPIEP